MEALGEGEGDESPSLAPSPSPSFVADAAAAAAEAARAAGEVRELRASVEAAVEGVRQQAAQAQAQARAEAEATARELRRRVADLDAATREGAAAAAAAAALRDEVGALREEVSRAWARASASAGSPSPSLDAAPTEGWDERMASLAEQVRQLERAVLEQQQQQHQQRRRQQQAGDADEAVGNGLGERVAEAEERLEGLSGQCSRIAGAVGSVGETVSAVITQSKEDARRVRDEVVALAEAVGELADRVVASEAAREALDELRDEVAQVRVAVEEGRGRAGEAGAALHSPWPSPPLSAPKARARSPALLAAQREVALELETEYGRSKSLARRWANRRLLLHDVVWLCAIIFFLRHPLVIQAVDLALSRAVAHGGGGGIVVPT